MTTFSDILKEDRFDFLSAANHEFILAFDEEMNRLGYDFGDTIGDGFCWGRYMLIYRRSGVKSSKVYARVYLREADIVLRLFLSGIDQHHQFIEQAPAHIQQVFTGHFGDCQHCKNEKDGQCKFRKTYTIAGQLIEKCNGNTFWFHQPVIEKLPDYIALFTEFYPVKKLTRKA